MRENWVMTDTSSGWFAYTPLSRAGLTDEQQPANVQQHKEISPIGEVHVFIHDLAPGQCEIRYAAARSSCIPNIVMLETAIRELTAALEILRGTEES